jgi:hypothetical protein
MDLNGGIHTLYSSSKLVHHYKQIFNYAQGLYTDSAYINYIEESQGKITITIPEQINIINNIRVNGAKFLVTDGKKIITDHIINIKKYPQVKIQIYNIQNYSNLTICYEVYLFKKQLQSFL